MNTQLNLDVTNSVKFVISFVTLNFTTLEFAVMMKCAWREAFPATESVAHCFCQNLIVYAGISVNCMVRFLHAKTCPTSQRRADAAAHTTRPLLTAR